MLFIALLIVFSVIFRNKYIKIFSYRSLLLLSFLGYNSYLLMPSYELDLLISTQSITNHIFSYIYFVGFIFTLLILPGGQPNLSKIKSFSSPFFLSISSLTLLVIELSVPINTQGASKSEQLDNLSNASSAFSSALLPSLFCFSIILGICAGKEYFSRDSCRLSTFRSFRKIKNPFSFFLLKTKFLKNAPFILAFPIFLYGIILVLAVFQQRASILTFLTFFYGVSISKPRQYILKVKFPTFIVFYCFASALFSVVLILMKPLLTIIFLPERDLTLEYISLVVSQRLGGLVPADLLPLESAVSLMHLNAVFGLSDYPSIYSIAAKFISFLPFLSHMSPYSSLDIVDQYIPNSLWGLAFNGLADSYFLAGWIGILILSFVLLVPLMRFKQYGFSFLQFLLFIPLIYPAIRIFRNPIDFSIGLYRYGLVYLTTSLVLYYALRSLVNFQEAINRKE